MRDRREALKLLAGGTAAAIGTSIITTSSAFADGGTVTCQPTGTASDFTMSSNVQRVEQGNKTQALTIQVSTGNLTIPSKGCVSCVAGAPTSPAATRQYNWSLESSPPGFGLYDATSNGTLYSGFANTSSVPGTVHIHRTANGDFQTATNSQDVFDFTLRLTVRWRCQYGSAYAWNCQSYRAVIRWQNNGNQADTSSFTTSFSPVGPGPNCESDSLPEVP